MCRCPQKPEEGISTAPRSRVRGDLGASPSRCCELTSYPPQEQPELLPTEPSLEPPDANLSQYFQSAIGWAHGCRTHYIIQKTHHTYNFGRFCQTILQSSSIDWYTFWNWFLGVTEGRVKFLCLRVHWPWGWGSEKPAATLEPSTSFLEAVHWLWITSSPRSLAHRQQIMGLLDLRDWVSQFS